MFWLDDTAKPGETKVYTVRFVEVMVALVDKRDNKWETWTTKAKRTGMFGSGQVDKTGEVGPRPRGLTAHRRRHWRGQMHLG